MSSQKLPQRPDQCNYCRNDVGGGKKYYSFLTWLFSHMASCTRLIFAHGRSLVSASRYATRQWLLGCQTLCLWRDIVPIWVKTY
ncbi:MAG: hypothetical protein RBJ76_20825 [Stenomitos frigidus ULC029]